MALNINEQARKEANLRLLQRSIDRSISDILGSATHVVLYQFQQSSQSWEKSNVEGSLFLAVRPKGYLLVILNRNSPDNYPIELSSDFQMQHKDPYLIFKQFCDGQTVIRGIWFPNANERIHMNDLLHQVLSSLQTTAPPETNSTSTTNTTANLTTHNSATKATAATTSSLGIGGGGVNTNAMMAAMTSNTAGSAPSSTAAGGGFGMSMPTDLDQGAVMASLLAPLSLGGVTSNIAATTTGPIGSQTNAVGSGVVGGGSSSVAGGGSSRSQSAPLRQTSPSQASNQPMLDKKSLQLALLSLIQDERFLDLLHAQYLKVAHARANRNNSNNSNSNN